VDLHDAAWRSGGLHGAYHVATLAIGSNSAEKITRIVHSPARIVP
jgi:hypothetical protein